MKHKFRIAPTWYLDVLKSTNIDNIIKRKVTIQWKKFN